jgi:hypothetical protein
MDLTRQVVMVILAREAMVQQMQIPMGVLAVVEDGTVEVVEELMPNMVRDMVEEAEEVLDILEVSQAGP